MYIPLRVHTPFSLAEGAIPIKDLARRCQDLGIPSVAVTDSGNLFGAFEFSKVIAAAGIQPLIGCTVSVKMDAMDPRHRSARTPLSSLNSDKLILIAKNEEGYKNLIKISSQGFRLNFQEKEGVQIPLSFIQDHGEHLIALTGGTEGAVARLLAAQSFDFAENYLLSLQQIFKDRLYVELTRQGIPLEDNSEDKLIDLAYAHKIPLVATNPAYFLEPSFYEAHEALLCIAEGKYILQEDRRKSSPHFALKTPEEMERLFADIPEAIENTLQIAERCAYRVRESAPQLPHFETSKGEKEELKYQAYEGLEIRLKTQVFTPSHTDEEKEAIRKTYRERLEYELGVIDQMGFNGYFLIVADFIQWAFAHDIPVGPGRGSGAGSVVAWVLKITGLDPIRFDLLFERFLNPERISMPDFDIDFCQERRDEVINYVIEKYGHERVAQIITFGKLQSRAVIRDVGRVLQMPYGQVDRLCKLIVTSPTTHISLQEAIDQEPQLQEERRKEESVDRLLSIGLKLEGLYRHASTHAAGVVISAKPLEEIVGLYFDPRSPMPVTQFNMKDVEAIGLLKFDFLGLKTLSVLQKTVQFLKQRNIDLNLDTIPLDDLKTYQLLHRMETVGIFQLESSGMRDVVGKLKPDRIEDIIALGALYRPGPMENIPQYIARRHGVEPVIYPHPLLEETLKETYGIAVYQEQVMKIAQVFAGYTLGGADILRRAMGKKIKTEMDAQRKIFVEGAAKNSVSEKEALAVFEQVEKFAGYGFNKSHAAAYAIISYQTAYLKANYPVEFMAASMAFDLNNTDKLTIFKQDLDRLEIPLLPPDINASVASFKVDQTSKGAPAIRYALGAIKNVGESAMEAVVQEREQKGAFKDIIDFSRRLDTKVINKRQLENLILSGAFDSLHANRRQLYENMDLILSHGGEAIQERVSMQGNLFGKGDQGTALPTLRLPETGRWSQVETLQKEFEAIGFYMTSHPLETYKSMMAKTYKIKASTIADYLSRNEGESIKMAGIIISKQERTSKTSGNRFAFVQLSDETGMFEVGFFSEQFTLYRDLLEPGTAVSLTISGRLEEGGVRLVAKSMDLLDKVLSQIPNHLVLKVRDLTALKALQNVLQTFQKGKSEITLLLDIGKGEIDVRLPDMYRIDEAQKTEIIDIPGVQEAYNVSNAN